MLLESLGLDGEHVTWAVGLVLIPLGHPGGGLEGETCKGALALQLCGYSTHYPHLLWKGS